MSGQILRACARCGAPFKPRHKGHRHCELHELHGNAHRSPTTRNRPSSSTQRERLRNTVVPEGTRCAIQLDGCEGLATVMDHIIAVADGGNHELSNLRPACNHCNSVLGGHTAAGTTPPSALRHGQDDRDSGPPVSRGVGRSAPVRSRRLH
jgi:hypothetical protein